MRTTRKANRGTGVAERSVTPPGARSHLLRRGTAMLGMTAVLATFAIGAASASPVTTARPASALQVPSLAWTDCGDGFQCATAQVPLDYHHPNRPKIGLGLTRKPATDPARRIGSLFINPGGPGGTTDDTVRFFGTQGPAELRARFDIIGFDPRGVGRSEPVACQSQAEYTQAWSQARSRQFPTSSVAG
jgi:pimeloyl-ACP methyl ester carboxylesterase